ncbi:twin-arginine translocation signal domain-containing protein [uncultured Rothia sp.]|uniref:twin-arginine translocation signal domain-containing protein n=1 Tax=uncultured Rothia sp. TaxID=316088 RepID=UPI0032177472
MKNKAPNRRDLIKALSVTTAVGIVGGTAALQHDQADKRPTEASTLDYYRGWRKPGPGRGFSSAFAKYRR